MEAYPDIVATVKSTTPLQWSDNFRILSTEYENEQSDRRLLDGYPQREIRLRYGPVVYAQAQTLRVFYERMKGPFQAFWFRFPQVKVCVKELVATATVNTTNAVLDLPSWGAQTYSMYRNGGLIDEGPDYSFSASSNIAVPDSATVYYVYAGDTLTWSFTGRLMIPARFSKTPLVFSDFKDMYSYITSELKSVMPQEVVI